MHPPISVDVHRAGHVESRHRCSVAAWEGGRTILALGDTGHPVFMRSAAKPFQALNFVISGAADRFGATEEELAVVCASHGAEEVHVRAVLSLLARAGLDGSALGCGAHPPLCAAANLSLAREGMEPEAVHNNCSGKHAGMLLTALQMGAPLDSYLDMEHPLQQLNRRHLTIFAGMEPEVVVLGVDGCSAPNFALPLENVAAAFSRLATPDDAIPAPLAAAAGRITAAMMAHPRMVAWEGRGDTVLMGSAPGRIVSKLGAEGVQGVGVPGRGLGIALKVEDGGPRPRLPVTLALLLEAGVITREEASSVGEPGDLVVRNVRGLEVGHISVGLPGETAVLRRGATA
jgi:L-asparaginase II